MKDLIKQFNLYGKITEQHAKDIEEILENYENRIRKETAEYEKERILKNIEKFHKKRWNANKNMVENIAFVDLIEYLECIDLKK